MFDIKMLRKELGSKRDEVSEQFRILNNEAIDPYKTEIMPKEGTY